MHTPPFSLSLSLRFTLSSLSGHRRFKSPSGSSPPFRFPQPPITLPPPLLLANANRKPHLSRHLPLVETSGHRSCSSPTSGDRSGNSSFALRLNFVEQSSRN